MKTRKWKPYILQILIAEAIGALSGLLSREGTLEFQQNAIQPSYAPPAFLFPIVWTILYGLMGISAARISLSPVSRERNRSINLYIAQLIVNFFWSLIFFNAQQYGAALIWLVLLWVLVALMIFNMYRVDKPAALLQIPYLLWLTFAAILNYGIWNLNR